MNQISNYPLLASPFLAWTDFVLLSTQMLLSSAQAIGYRASRMLLIGDTPAAHDEQEFDAMGAEKASAAVQSTQTMTQGLFELGEELSALTRRQMFAGLPLMMSLAARGMSQSAPSTPVNAPIPVEYPAKRTPVPRPVRTHAAPRRGANGKRASKRDPMRAPRKTGAHHMR